MVAVGAIQDFVFQNQLGCDSLVNLTVAPYPVDFQSVDLISCPGQPALFDGQALMPGDTMSFVYQNQHGCDSTVTVTVGLFQAASPTVMELFVCTGDSLVYNGETLWPGDVRNYVFQDENGCDSLVNLTVLAHPVIDFKAFTEAVCPGSFDGVIELVAMVGDGPFSTSLDGSSFSDETRFEALPQGNHQITLKDAHGCIASQLIEIEALDSLVLEVEDYVLPCEEPSITLRPKVLSHAGPLHWAWPDGSTYDWFRATQGGLYLVSVSDDCTTKEQPITVHWGDDTPASPVYVPNAFSPNGDGVNDEFMVYPAQGVEFLAFELLVFDRWGNLLFSSQDHRSGWDGFYREKRMDTGLVVWYLNAKITSCGRELELFQEGGVTVMR